jgi:CDP-4-dehydro-6-deoxyglucose reductase
MSKACTVTIEGTGRTFVCDGGTVLDAAIAQGIQLPYNCRGGACGTCKAEVLEGAVEHGWVMGFAITDEEIGQGNCLICSSKPKTERLRLRMRNTLRPTADFGPIVPAEHTVEVVAAHNLTPSVRRVTVMLADPPSFRFDNGMYMEIMLEGVEPSRPYSIATTANEDGTAPQGMISFLVTRHEHGTSSKRIHETIVVGDRLRIRGPYGTFRVPASVPRKILMLAGGTGLAPLLSMVRRLLVRGDAEQIELFFSVRARCEVFLLDELHELSSRHVNFRFRVFVTRRDEAVIPDHWERRCITDYLTQMPRCLDHGLVLIAGAPSFVKACTECVLGAGIDADAILRETYDLRIHGSQQDHNQPAPLVSASQRK